MGGASGQSKWQGKSLECAEQRRVTIGNGLDFHPPPLVGGILALRATFRLHFPVKKRHTDPFQTPSKVGHPSYPSSRRLGTTFPSHQMP